MELWQTHADRRLSIWQPRWTVLGLKACSADTGASCLARKRLPERFFSAVAFWVGRNLDARVDPQWLWKGRRVYLYDGSTVSMPDTEKNRKEYPLTYNQEPGTGFPLARIGALISLSCGAIMPTFRTSA